MRIMKITAGLFMTAILALSLQAQTTWKADKSHSRIQFEVSHMVINDVMGNFTDFSINVESEGKKFEGAKVEVVIDAKSINTDNEKRDNHLRSEDFLDVEKHPKIIFKSKSMKKEGADTYKLSGDLTIRGNTKEVVLEATHTGTIQDPYGNTRAGFKVRGEINRFDFDVSWDQRLDSGGMVVGKTIYLIGKLEIVQE